MKEVKVGDLVAVWCLDEDLADYDGYGAPDHIGVVLTRPSYVKSVFDYIVLTSSCKVIWIFRNDFVKVISKREDLSRRPGLPRD